MILLQDKTYKIFPNSKLDPNKIISQTFLDLDINTFQKACDYVWKLPYGRNSDRSNWKLVLSEQKGTCSTKHALLKSLADEIHIDVDLVVAIYSMNEKNTPGVEEVLKKHDLSYVDEAHCFLVYQNIYKIDLTRHNIPAEQKILFFSEQKIILPDDIGDTKIEFHKNYIKKRFGKQYDFYWSVREECIKVLGKKG